MNNKPTKGSNPGSINFKPSGSPRKGNIYPQPPLRSDCVRHSPSGDVSFKHERGPKMSPAVSAPYRLNQRSAGPGRVIGSFVNNSGKTRAYKR